MQARQMRTLNKFGRKNRGAALCVKVVDARWAPDGWKWEKGQPTGLQFELCASASISDAQIS
jgi:hypothetical protein